MTSQGLVAADVPRSPRRSSTINEHGAKDDRLEEHKKPRIKNRGAQKTQNQ